MNPLLQDRDQLPGIRLMYKSRQVSILHTRMGKINPCKLTATAITYSQVECKTVIKIFQMHIFNQVHPSPLVIIDKGLKVIAIIISSTNSWLWVRSLESHRNPRARVYLGLRIIKRGRTLIKSQFSPSMMNKCFSNM